MVLGEYFNSTMSNGKEGVRDIPEADWVVWVFAYIKRMVMLSHSCCPSLRRCLVSVHPSI